MEINNNIDMTAMFSLFSDNSGQLPLSKDRKEFFEGAVAIIIAKLKKYENYNILLPLSYRIELEKTAKEAVNKYIPKRLKTLPINKVEETVHNIYRFISSSQIGQYINTIESILKKDQYKTLYIIYANKNYGEKLEYIKQLSSQNELGKRLVAILMKSDIDNIINFAVNKGVKTLSESNIDHFEEELAKLDDKSIAKEIRNYVYGIAMEKIVNKNALFSQLENEEEKKEDIENNGALLYLNGSNGELVSKKILNYYYRNNNNVDDYFWKMKDKEGVTIKYNNSAIKTMFKYPKDKKTLNSLRKLFSEFYKGDKEEFNLSELFTLLMSYSYQTVKNAYGLVENYNHANLRCIMDINTQLPDMTDFNLVTESIPKFSGIIDVVDGNNGLYSIVFSTGQQVEQFRIKDELDKEFWESLDNPYSENGTTLFMKANRDTIDVGNLKGIESGTYENKEDYYIINLQVYYILPKSAISISSIASNHKKGLRKMAIPEPIIDLMDRGYVSKGKILYIGNSKELDDMGYCATFEDCQTFVHCTEIEEIKFNEADDHQKCFMSHCKNCPKKIKGHLDPDWLLNVIKYICYIYKVREKAPDKVVKFKAPKMRVAIPSDTSLSSKKVDVKSVSLEQYCLRPKIEYADVDRINYEEKQYLEQVDKGVIRGHHASPREHYRRGHWRHYKNDKKVYIEGCIVNAGHEKMQYNIKGV